MNDNSPWKTLSTKGVYDNPWIRVEEHEVINPGGGRNVYGKVCFKNVAVAIAAIDDDQHLYLVGQYRYPLQKYSWELPMGGAPLSEAPIDAAKRELKEETGLTAERWTEIMKLDISNSITDETGVVFVARGLEHGEPDFDETEDLVIRREPFEKAVQMVQRGEITDAVSAAAILNLAVMESPQSRPPGAGVG